MKKKICLFAIAGLLAVGCNSSKSEDNTNGGGAGHSEPSAHSDSINLSGDAKTVAGNESHPDTSAIQKIKRSVFVPEEVKGKWKAVKLIVKDKKSSSQEEKVVNLGDEFDITGSSIHVAVKEFMPHLSIGETSFTSLSNNPVNPAVHLVITEAGKELFDGWAYAQFPEMYHFRHDKYSVTLVDYVPAG